jgi:membrane-associated phospholipid phosphatase
MLSREGFSRSHRRLGTNFRFTNSPHLLSLTGNSIDCLGTQYLLREAMNAFDYAILQFFNQVAEGHPLFTHVVTWACEDSLKTGLIVALFWWAWFKQASPQDQILTRQRIVASLIGSIACIALVRAMAAVLPFRVRPLANTSVHLHFPIDVGIWGQWSAFPSDNAVLFSLLATCLFVVSRRLGSIAAITVALFICFPRVYVGIHHPTDVLAGAAMGIAAGWFLTREQVCSPIARPALATLDRHPQAFYASAFLVTFLFAQVFWPATRLAISFGRAIRVFASV